MPKSEVFYDKENIYGQAQCQLPNGLGLCGICCFVMEVPTLNKPRHTQCRYQSKNGCTVHGTELQPDECKKFFCVRDLSNNMKWELINTALRLRVINKSEAENAKKLWLVS